MAAGLLERLGVGIYADTGDVKSGFDKVPSLADSAVDEAEAKFEEMDFSAAAAVAGATAGGLLVAGVLEGMERGALGDKLAAQLNLTEAESAQAGSIAGSLYADAYGDSLEHVNEAVGGVASGLADLDDEGAVERLSAKALDFAATFDEDVTGAIGTVKNLIASGLARDADHAFDLITAGAQEIAPHLRGELGDATTEYAKFFADLGITGEQTFGLLAQADDQFELDKTGDALKELSIRATDMSTASVAAYEAAGLDAKTMADRILAGGDTAKGAFDDIVDGLIGIEDPTERANAAIGLFGTPLEDLGVSKIPAFLEQLDSMGDGLGDVEGRADSMGATLNDNAQTTIEGYRRSFQGMLASVVEAPGPFGAVAGAAAGVGGALMPIIPAISSVGMVFSTQLGAMATTAGSKVGSIVSSGASWVAATARQGASVVATMATTAASTAASWAAQAGAAVAQGARAVAAGAAWAASMVAQGATAVASMAATAAATVASWAVMAAQATANAVRMAAAWVIAMGPVGWVIAAVIGLVALIIANWDKVKAWTGKIWSWITDKVAAAWRWMKDTTSSAVTAVVGFFGGLYTGAKQKVSDLVTSVRTFFTDMKDKAVDAATGLRDTVVERVGALKDKAIEKMGALVEWVKGLPGRLVDALVTLGAKLIESGRVGFQMFRDGVEEKATGLVEFVTGYPAKLVAAVGNLGSLLVEKGKDVVRGLWDGISSMAGWIADKVMGFVRNVIPGPIRKALGISSPSKVAADLAREVPRGMVVGMEGELGRLERMSERVAMTALPSLSSPSVPRLSSAHLAGADRDDNRQPRTMVLRVGDREFTAYVDERADGVVSSRNRQLLGRVAAGVR